MWDNLLRVDWGRLTHAYGWASNVPEMLRNMVSPDETARAAGWDAFWGAVNHQGDFYDSTVAAVPFLLEAMARPETPERERILDYFRVRWLDAPLYGGDPILTEPPGGIDEPTPMLTGDAPPPSDEAGEESEEEFDIASYRRMDLCAWQTGRAIQAGQPTYERLLEDPNREVAAAAAELLLPWPETRAAAKRVLVRMIESEPDSTRQAQRILEFGVYGSQEDVPTFAEWVAPRRPAEARAAAALAWAWVVIPDPVPELAARALADGSAVDCGAFALLPWAGLWHQGPWGLPANAAELVLRLADNHDDELRWRAVQGLAVGRETARHVPPERVVPVLVKRLSDRSDHVREAATFALSQRGESVLDIEPGAVSALIGALDGGSSSACGHAARLLGTVAHRLAPARREEAAAGVERAARRFAGRRNSFVHFYSISRSMGVPAGPFLREQHAYIVRPTEWGVSDLLADLAFPDKQDRRLAPLECDRRLAAAYARAPRETIAAAGEAARDPEVRNAAVGAANWLTTLGPAAEPALPALDAMAEGELDDYAQRVARAAAEFIRKSLLVEPGRAAEAVETPPEPEKRLADDSAAEVGVAGPFEFEGGSTTGAGSGAARGSRRSMNCSDSAASRRATACCGR
jgi:hypothetical protein